MHTHPPSAGSRRRPGRTSAGFTLVELLVVIGIIALLIGILLPTLSRARAAAKTIHCASTLRSFGLANSIYSNEEQGWYVPVKTDRGTNDGSGGVWYGTVNYIRWDFNIKFRELLLQEEIPDNDRSTLQWAEGWPEGLYCPESTRGKEVDNHISNRNYAMNRSGVYLNTYRPRDTGSTWDDSIVIKNTQVQDAAQKIQMIDAAYWVTDGGEHNSNSDYRVWWDKYGYGTGMPNGMVSYRHDEGANVQFFDGHVETMKKQAVHQDDEKSNRLIWDIFPVIYPDDEEQS